MSDPSPITIRPAVRTDAASVWSIIGPTIRAGETYALPRDLPESEAVDYWMGGDRRTFVAEADGRVLGTYYLRPNQQGGGAHVCNCGYVTAAEAAGRGVARAMCAHSLEQARAAGYRAMQFNFVVSTNTRAIRLWKTMGFEVVGVLPQAFAHPTAGYVDALVMFRQL